MEGIEIKEIRQLKQDDMFLLVKKDGTTGKTVYVRDYYDRSERKFWAYKYEDINDGRFFKADTKVTEDFIY